MNYFCIRLALLMAGLLPAARGEFRLFLVNGSSEQEMPPIYSLGTIVEGDAAQARFRLRNMAAAPALLTYLEVRGTGFGPKNPLVLPLTLDTQAAVEFTVTFSAPEFGAYSAALVSEGISVILTAKVVAAPPLPSSRLVVVLPPPRSAQQGSVMVVLDAPAPRAAGGNVTLDFQPGPAGASDPAIIFSSGTRTAGFTCDPGETVCRFGGQQNALFQTGTTTGVLTFTARLGGVSSQTTVKIPPAVVGISNAQGARFASTIEVSVTGFDNTRTAGPLAFTFFDRAGVAIPPGTIRADAAGIFQRFYQDSDAGGAFVLRAVFPVSGDLSRIAAFAATIGNSEGAATTPLTQF